jgi:hypothetical protein
LVTLESRLLWSGAIGVEAIDVVSEATSTRTVDADIEAAIDAEWQRQLDEAAARGFAIYDAPAFRLNGYEIAGDRISLRLATIPYRYHAAFKAIHTRSDLRDDHADRVLIADSVIRTADGQIVMHTVEKVVESETYLIGGTCSTSRIAITRGADLAAYVLDRVDAVTGLREGERAIGDLVALVQNEIGCVHAIFDVHTSLSASAMVARFAPGATSKALVVVPGERMRDWCLEARGYMRVLADCRCR